MISYAGVDARLGNVEPLPLWIGALAATPNNVVFRQAELEKQEL